MFNFVYKEIDFAHKLDYASSPKDEYIKHMHPFVEILYFISGDVIYSVDGKKIKLKKGDCLFIKPGSFHFANVNRNILYERYVLKFPESLIPNNLKDELFSNNCIFNLKNIEDEIFKSLDKYCLFLSEENMRIICISKLLELLVVLTSSTSKKEEKKTSSLINNIVNYIDEHIEDNVTIDQLSNVFSYSKSYISSYFNKEMKISIMKYIRTKRIIHAHILISNGNKPKDVFEMMKFNEYSTFYRQYKKMLNNNPINDYVKNKNE